MVESTPMVVGGTKKASSSFEVLDITVVIIVIVIVIVTSLSHCACNFLWQENCWKSGSYQLKEKRQDFSATIVPSSFFHCWGPQYTVDQIDCFRASMWLAIFDLQTSRSLRIYSWWPEQPISACNWSLWYNQMPWVTKQENKGEKLNQ